MVESVKQMKRSARKWAFLFFLWGFPPRWGDIRLVLVRPNRLLLRPLPQWTGPNLLIQWKRETPSPDESGMENNMDGMEMAPPSEPVMVKCQKTTNDWN